jgi:hypothetical protein
MLVDLSREEADALLHGTALDLGFHHAKVSLRKKIRSALDGNQPPNVLTVAEARQLGDAFPPRGIASQVDAELIVQRLGNWADEQLAGEEKEGEWRARGLR